MALLLYLISFVSSVQDQFNCCICIFRVNTSVTSFSMKSTDEKISIDDGKNITLSFHDIRYEVQEKIDDVPFCGKIVDKEILCGIRYPII